MAATNVQAFPGDVVIPGKQYAIELQADLAEADKSATTWYRLLKGGLRQGSDGYSTKCELLVHASGLHECVTFDFNYMIQLVGAGGCGLNVYRHDSFFSRVGIVKFRLTEYANYVFYLDMKIDHDVVGVDRTWTVNLKVVQGGSAVEAPTTFLEKITSYTNIVAHREYDIGLSAFAVMPTSNAAPFTIMSTGNVGIGVTAPLNALHVSSDNFATFARGTGSAGWSGIRLGIPYTTNHDAYCSVIESYNDAASNYSSILRFKTSSGDNAAATERMCIDSVGNVGIGTTTPKQPLEVKTTAVVSGRFGVGTVLTSAQNGGGQDIWNLGTAARLVVRCLNNSDTTASYANAKAYAGIALVPGFDAADTTNMGLWGTGSGENPRFYIQNMINNGANGGNSILLQPVAGSVGIGTISPGYTLDVNGTIGATSGIIYGTGSDGIFTVKNTNTPAIVRLITSGNQVYFQSGTAMSTNSRADINFTSMYAAYTYLKINGSNGYIGHGTASPASRMHHKQPADQGGGAGLGSYQNGLILERSGTTDRWTLAVDSYKSLCFFANASRLGYLLSTGSDGRLNFTGQHRTFIKDVPFTRAEELEGLIVSADNNKYIKMNGGVEAGSNAITVNESLPIVSISTKVKDKKCFGVISASEDPETRTEQHGNFVSDFEKELGDTRVYINSVGEGAIWVSNIGGTLESGDYITTSNVAGYGQKQESDSLKNYTVAKITMDCDFNPVTQPIKIIKKELQDVNYWVRTTYTNVTQEQYSNLNEETRTTKLETYYTNEEGEITQEEYSNLSESNSSTYTELTRTIYQEISKEELKSEDDGYIVEVRQELVNVLDEDSHFQWEDTDQTEKAYKIRYLDASGARIDEANAVHIAAFVGCTYHCG